MGQGAEVETDEPFRDLTEAADATDSKAETKPQIALI